jgi:hypothetical protein
MKEKLNIDTAKRLWQKETSKYIAKAIENISEYPPEIQDIIKEEAIQRGLYNYDDFKNSSSEISLHEKWIDLSSDVQTGSFCPACKKVYLSDGKELCQQCNVSLKCLGYCSECDKFWQLIPGESCPKDGSKLTDRRLTRRERFLNMLYKTFYYASGFVIYLIFKEYFGLIASIPIIGTILCLLIFNKILPPAKKPLVWAVSLQIGWYLSFSIVAIVSRNINVGGLAETLVVLGFVLWLILKPNIYPVIILTIIHILALLAISLSVLSLIKIENTNPTLKGLLINMIFKIPAIILMYMGLGKIKHQN